MTKPVASCRKHARISGLECEGCRENEAPPQAAKSERNGNDMNQCITLDEPNGVEETIRKKTRNRRPLPPPETRDWMSCNCDMVAAGWPLAEAAMSGLFGLTHPANVLPTDSSKVPNYPPPHQRPENSEPQASGNLRGLAAVSQPLWDLSRNLPIYLKYLDLLSKSVFTIFDKPLQCAIRLLLSAWMMVV
jgi:hypothetical protein